MHNNKQDPDEESDTTEGETKEFDGAYADDDLDD